MSKRRVPGPLQIAFGATLFTTLIGLLTAEFILLPRLLGASRQTALLGLVANAQRVDDTEINAIGFTGDIPAIEKPAGVRRILVLGASPVFDRRWTERFKARVKARTEMPVEVLGAALRTHTSRASVIKYRALAKYRFDVVLIYEGINDLWANHVPADRFRDDYAHLDPWYNRAFPLDHSLVARVAYNRWAADDTRALADFLSNSPRSLVNGADFRSASTLYANLRELITAIRQDGGVPVLMTFAWTLPDNYTRQAFESGDLGYINPDHYDEFPVELWGPPAFVRDGLTRHDRVVRQVASEMEVFMIDQKRWMDNRIELFGDVCHFNDQGTDIFIEHLVDALNAEGLI